MQDPRLLQFNAEAVAELGGNAELLLTQAEASEHDTLLESNPSSSSDSVNGKSPPPKYEEFKLLDRHANKTSQDLEKTYTSDQCCEQGCPCVCHNTEKVLPHNLVAKPKTSSSSLVARFVRVCTLRRCKKRRRSKGYHVSSQTINKALGISLISWGFNHRSFLHAYNTVPETSDSIRYAISGNLEGLVMLVRTNQATINDAAPDGWSLLHVRNSLTLSRVHAHVSSPPLTGAICTLFSG
jgi:hypothetical protein